MASGLSVWVWIGLIVLIVMIGTVGMVIVRRRYFSDDGAELSGEPLTLHDLREMRDAGRVDDEEYERLRAMIVGAVGGRSGGEGPSPRRLDGVLEAPPGFDLTGEPLPKPPGESTNAQGGETQP